MNEDISKLPLEEQIRYWRDSYHYLIEAIINYCDRITMINRNMGKSVDDLRRKVQEEE